ncbi:MAG: Lrp/AsnC family transcriptional regulator [Candidatus Heimdallarchaeota archaeon]
MNAVMREEFSSTHASEKAAISHSAETYQDIGRKVDDVDLEIIKQLIINSRISFSELGDLIGKSRATARERVARLQSKKVIEFGVAVRREVLESFIVGLLTFKAKKSKIGLSFDDCPRILAALGPDRKGNFTIMMLGESKPGLRTCAKRFKARNAGQHTSFSLNFSHLQVPYYILLRNSGRLRKNDNSCRSKCPDCDYFLKGECYGCPVGDHKFNAF